MSGQSGLLWHMSHAPRTGATRDKPLRRVYRFRLYPTRQQRERLEVHLGAACALYNAALEHRRTAWRAHGLSVSYSDQSRELKELRAAGLIPRDANFWSQQAVLRQLDRAFAAFFRRLAAGTQPGFPRYKAVQRFNTLSFTSKGNAGGARVTDAGRLRLQAVGDVKVNWHRAIPTAATLGEVKVTRSAGGRRWHVGFYVELPAVPAEPKTGRAVGIDLGVRALVALSNGVRIDGPRAQARSRRAVRRSARRVARRVRAKARILLAQARERERRRRRDHAHKLARDLVRQYDLIAAERLHIRDMIRSPCGTSSRPGRGVRQKRGLNREIQDQGWGQLLTMLAYKAEEAGRHLVYVSSTKTSQTCAACGAVDARSRVRERFHCVSCAHLDDADVNAAKIVLSRALACEDAHRSGRDRQAPTAAVATVA